MVAVVGKAAEDGFLGFGGDGGRGGGGGGDDDDDDDDDDDGDVYGLMAVTRMMIIDI